MYVLSQRMRWEPLRTEVYEDISSTYTPLGTALENPARIIKVVNTTDVTITISTDAINDMDVVPSGSFFLYDISTNKTEQSTLFVDQGTVFYVKGSPSSGAVYLVVIYAASY
jgi:hypothetical protein